MADANPIRISFDQMTAVRTTDGLRLKAQYRPPEAPLCGHGRCTGCRAGDYSSGCLLAPPYNRRDPVLVFDKQCMSNARKDGRCITWVPA